MTSPAVIDAQHLQHQHDASIRNFGPEQTPDGVLDHIRKELDEIAQNPGDITEWADLLLLAFDGAMRAGHKPQQIIDAIKAKQAANEAREWPDWRTRDPDKAIEHVRDDSRRWIKGHPDGPRRDVDGVEWWACDPYPTWYRADRTATTSSPVFPADNENRD